MEATVDTKFDLKRFSKELSYPEFMVKKILGIKFEKECPAKTLEEAYRMYFSHPDWSEEKFLAHEKWKEFSAEEIKNSDTLLELSMAEKRAHGSSEIKSLIWAKKIELTSDWDDLKTINSFVQNDEVLKNLLIKKMAGLAGYKMPTISHYSV